MPEPILRRLRISKDTALIHGLHWLAKGAYQTREYQWELRRNGETKLGYWRKTLRTRDARSSYPKRFVLIPGFGDSPLSWSVVMGLLYPVLKKNFDELILLDFPGFGGFLNKERSFPSMDLMIAGVHDALDSLKPHTIMGHSLGAWLAALYAGSCGEGMRPTANKKNYTGPDTVLFVSPSGIFLNQQVRDEWERIFRSAMGKGFSSLRPHVFAKEPPWFRLLIPSLNYFFTRDDIYQFMGTLREEHCANKAAAKIKSKVWLIWGECDTLIPASCTRAWFRHLNSNNKDHQNAVWLRGAGHSPQFEKPVITAAVLSQLLAGKKPHPIGSRWWQVFRNETESQ